MKKSNIIATIIFVLLSIACIIAITTCTKTPTIQDGIWTGSGEGFKGEMTIQITTKDGKIVDTELLSIKDSDFAKEYALKLLDTIEEKGTVEGVDALSGATYTSRGVLDAVKDATKKATGKNEKAKVSYSDTETDIVVIGAGGYVTGPVIWAAKKLGKKTFIHEQNSVVGLSNKYLTKYADKVGVSFASTESCFPKEKAPFRFHAEKRSG